MIKELERKNKRVLYLKAMRRKFQEVTGWECQMLLRTQLEKKKGQLPFYLVKSKSLMTLAIILRALIDKEYRVWRAEERMWDEQIHTPTTDKTLY